MKNKEWKEKDRHWKSLSWSFSWRCMDACIAFSFMTWHVTMHGMTCHQARQEGGRKTQLVEGWVNRGERKREMGLPLPFPPKERTWNPRDDFPPLSRISRQYDARQVAHRDKWRNAVGSLMGTGRPYALPPCIFGGHSASCIPLTFSSPPPHHSRSIPTVHLPISPWTHPRSIIGRLFLQPNQSWEELEF